MMRIRCIGSERTWNRLRRNWDYLARRSPYWAVLSDGPFDRGTWSPDAFYATGIRDSAALIERLKRRSPDAELATARLADIGCGPGRLTLPLAAHFAGVDGYDLSSVMLALAEERVVSGNPRFYLIKDPQLSSVNDGEYDVVLANLVLQHIPGQSRSVLLRNMARIVTRGGLLLFNCVEPVDGVGRFRYASRRIGHRSVVWIRPGSRIEIHPLSRRTAEDTIRDAGSFDVGFIDDAGVLGKWSGYWCIAQRHD